ncbi:MAG: trypsin-like peptidase domain-containing protein [Candidatus Sungbacteria bacterium]|nr:trypsin-like peptidase domain-containing protein [Candidatus Sungbacteria bacterium]
MEHQPTTRQLILFSVVLSFVVSIIGTILSLSVFGPLIAGPEAGSGGTIVYHRPSFLEKITQTTPEKIKDDVVVPVRPEDTVEKVVASASPAVVSVVASKDVPIVEQYYVDPFGDDPLFKQFFGDNGPSIQIPQLRQKGTRKQDVSAGTGFFVSSDGLIITNKHVVADKEASYTVLMNDGKKLPAKVLARDPIQDLAVLQVVGSNFPSLRPGDSSQVKIGQTVIAIGNALGEFRNTVSVGVISGLQRSIVAQGGASGPEALQELIQTDAAINPGNSGGPLLNIRGEVIGINTAVASGAQGIGFALPINKAKRDLENIKAYGRFIYPFLGVRYVIVSKELAAKQGLKRDYGALVAKGENEGGVATGSPASVAGLKEGDIILFFDGERIDIDHPLSALIQKHKVGETVTLRIFRDDKEFDVKVKLEERK